MSKPKNEAAVALGKLAGKKNRKRGKKFFSGIGKKGASSRWKKERPKLSDEEILSRKIDRKCSWEGRPSSDKTAYNSAHVWMKRAYKKKNVCEDCGTREASSYDWALLSKTLLKDRKNWKELCRKCHIKMDRKLSTNTVDNRLL